MKSLNTLLTDIYRRLLNYHGHQYWWPGESNIEIVIGAILTQGANWEAVNKSINLLKQNNLLNLESLRNVDEEQLAGLIKASIYFNQKTKKIKALVHHVFEKHQGDINNLLTQDKDSLRRELLSIYGIGDETADDIILYAAQKPVFVIDNYTKRILKRIGISIENEHYQNYQKFFMDNLDEDVSMFNEYHALLDEHASSICTKSDPFCEKCCLNDICLFRTEHMGT
jgi:endonuclease-3 related protein